MTKQQKDSQTQNTSIDEKHKEMLNTFDTHELNTIPELKNEKEMLKQYIKSLKTYQIEEYMDKKDRIRQINEKIKELKSFKKSICWKIQSMYFNILNKRKRFQQM